MKIPFEALKSAVAEMLVATGESPENAAVSADCMAKCDARGTITHGSYLLSPIRMRAEAGQLSLPTKAVIIKDSGATAVIDGGDGLGTVAGTLAAETAAKKAKEFGVSCVTIKNTNNIGALVCYTEAVARQGMLAIMCCNAAAAMAPWGAAEVFLGTNPMAIAIYTGHDRLFSADMATSIVARGKIRKAMRDGKEIPDNWATDADGNFTTDPAAAIKGALLPMGGPKGSAIALAIDIASGIMAGASHAPDLKSFHVLEGQTGVGAALIAIDISRFLDLDEFRDEMDDYYKSVKELKKSPGTDEIRIPGENSFRKEQKSRDEGVELDDKAVQTLNEILKEIGSETRLG